MKSRESSVPLRLLAAVIDLGTNAARLAMASLDESGNLVSRGRWRELVRLGEGLAATGELSRPAMERGLEALKKFWKIIEEHSIDRLDVLATSALREASNGGEFIAEAKKLGILLRIISADEEARLALAGVVGSIEDFPEEALVFDIGGGSIELIRSQQGRVGAVVSIPAGVVYLTERYLRDIPTPPEQVSVCAGQIRQMLDNIKKDQLKIEISSLIGCGGAVALAWFVREGIVGNLGINGELMTFKEIGAWVKKFSALNVEERGSLPGFEVGREDVALAGLIFVEEIFKWTEKSSFRVSTGGVREGRLSELLQIL